MGNFVSDAFSGVGRSVGSLARTIVNATPIAMLAEQMGMGNIVGAVVNIFTEAAGQALKLAVSTAPVPQFMRDLAGDAIDGAVEGAKMETTPEAEDVAMEQLFDSVAQAGRDAVEEATGIANKSGARGGNWLAVLAKAMGDVAGQHLGKAVELANNITAISNGPGESSDKAVAMAGDQAMMQAEMQLFKMAQEGVTTVIKSVGEALTSTARKQ